MPKGYKAIFDFNKSETWKGLEADYLTADEWCERDECVEDDRFNLLSVINDLTLAERRILLTYAETGTYAETARIFNVNPKTVKNYIHKLRTKILDLLARKSGDLSHEYIL